ncbi:restriction endonuclease subunit S [Flavobacterium sp.]|uniref:restriction endonuclease subunit S n=1 Tax=Flavobacterium sp. TaxID=239 RepID=UPI00326436DD
MQKYEQYKNSGVEWLGEIPEHWKVSKFKSFLTIHGRIGFRGYTVNDLVVKGEGAITISPSNMGDSKMIWDKVSYLSWKKYYESPEIMVEEEDLLIVKTASIGKVAFVKNLNEKATINPQLLILKNISINKTFLYYQLISYFIQHQLNTEKIGSTIYTISENKVLNFKAINPPLQEQTAIAEFLGDKTAKIDQAIGIKQQQIDLLKERRQILIHKAVTQGINPEVKLKNSGVEWIGEIPEHWEVKKLFGLCRFVRGNSTFSKDELLNNGQYVALQYGKTYKVNEVDKNYNFYVNDEFYKDTQIVNYGDTIFISTSETIEDLGHSAFYNRSDLGLLGGEQLILKPDNEKINSHYLYFSSKVFSKELRKYAKGIKVFRFNINDLKTIYTAVPPLAEQKEISEFIETVTTKISTAISLKEQETEKLKEYKSSLIDGVVTGKVRVF